MTLQPVKATSITASNKTPSDRFIIGESGCYFEAAKYLTDKLPPTKVQALFDNPSSAMAVTEGKSLKVMFTTPTGEIKFMGFVTAGDASLELDEEDIAIVQEHIVSGVIAKAISADELVDLF